MYLVYYPIYVNTDDETVVSWSNLSNASVGALMRDEQGGWREVET